MIHNFVVIEKLINTRKNLKQVAESTCKDFDAGVINFSCNLIRPGKFLFPAASQVINQCSHIGFLLAPSIKSKTFSGKIYESYVDRA